MAITIRHGANGGYKSSSIVQEHIIPALIEGRVVVTNIRGVSLDRFYDVGIDVNSSSEIIYIDTDNTPLGRDGRRLISQFWHWVPENALLCFDESGVMFPKAWRDSDLKKLNEFTLDSEYVSSLEIPSFDRPSNFIEAFEMHRHYGWDIVLSAPNIKSIRDDIKNTTELAWRHRNAALVGLKGRYKVISHDPVNSGTSASHILESKICKINPRTFECYDSTKTGPAKDTANAANALLGSPRFLLALAVSAFAFYYSLSSGGLDFFSSQSVQAPAGSNVVVGSQTNSSNVSSSVSIQQVDRSSSFLILGYEMKSLHITGRFGKYYHFESKDLDGNSYSITVDHLTDSGFQLVPKTDCRMLLIIGDKSRSVYCQLKPNISDDEYDEFLSDDVEYDDNSLSDQV